MGNGTVSTKKAFESLDLQPERETREIAEMLNAIDNNDLKCISKTLYNCFDVLKLSDPVIESIMIDNGALGTSLSGSGPSVFGIFKEYENAHAAYKKLTENGYKAFICRPYYRSE